MGVTIRRAASGADARFWGLLLAVLSVAIYGWYAREFERHVGLAVISGDGTLHPRGMLERVAAYGVAGRRAYVAFLSLACLVPVTGSLVLLRLYETLGEPRYRRVLTLLAVLPALLALLENTLHALLAMLHPGGGLWLATLAYVVTVAKALACAGAALALAVVASGWVRRRVDADPHETI
ncbi:MAG TPA: hypothetical protein VFX59_10795 [Polyangiales bacterium]|nr:hypothetical protein [Polyangiales bacterium]